MGRPPTTEEIKHRKELVSVGLKEALGLDSAGRDTYTGDWIEISTFALLHSRSHFCTAEGAVPGDELTRLKYREPLFYFDYTDFTRLEFNERESIESADKYDSLVDHTTQTDDSHRPAVITYGPDETFWQALGAFELAKEGYVVFPEELSRRWTHGLPDLTCFRLGRLQEVLADIGLIPGGAPLQEIQFRAQYKQYEPTELDVTETIGVAEAKGEGRGRQGVRELVEYRNSKRDAEPYLDDPAIEEGWLISPLAHEEISLEKTEVGTVTWDKRQASYVPSPQYRVDYDEQARKLQAAKGFVLDTILRHYELTDSLNSTIEDCVEEPELLYSILE